LFTLLQEATAGSDTQLLLARSFAAQSSTEAHFTTLAGLVDGSVSIDGLAIDTEMRWALLTALVAGGRAGTAEIDAELLRDDTATGRVHAATARAAIPTPEAKAAAWKSVVEDGALPNAVQDAVIAGFGRVHDRSLLAPFVTPYFESLTRIWSERTSEMASQIAVGLFPSGQPGDVVLPASDAWLADETVEPSLRRMVIEGRDAAARAERAQARDRQSPATS
jgi:aminopeptidase N